MSQRLKQGNTAEYGGVSEVHGPVADGIGRAEVMDNPDVWVGRQCRIYSHEAAG